MSAYTQTLKDSCPTSCAIPAIETMLENSRQPLLFADQASSPWEGDCQHSGCNPNTLSAMRNSSPHLCFCWLFAEAVRCLNVFKRFTEQSMSHRLRRKAGPEPPFATMTTIKPGCKPANRVRHGRRLIRAQLNHQSQPPAIGQRLICAFDKVVKAA